MNCRHGGTGAVIKGDRRREQELPTGIGVDKRRQRKRTRAVQSVENERSTFKTLCTIFVNIGRHSSGREALSARWSRSNSREKLGLPGSDSTNEYALRVTPIGAVGMGDVYEAGTRASMASTQSPPSLYSS
jgi:hypothetical protein